MMSLILGSAKYDITPRHPVPLSGFGVRNNKLMEGIQSAIYLRALFIQQNSLEGEKKALIVSADILWWGTDRMEYIRGQLAKRFDLKPEFVILNATHSHSGPQHSFLFHRILGQADAKYVEELEAKLFEAVEAAIANAEPVTIERGLGVCYNGAQRRRYIDGQVFGGPDLDGPNDHDLNVIRYTTLSGKIKALMVHYACHPVISTVNKVSSEFTGYAMERLERELDGAVSVFLQGCTADINVNFDLVDRSMDPFEKIAFFGNKLADAVLETIQRPMDTLAPTVLRGVNHIIPLQLRPLASREELEALVEEGQMPYDEWAATMLSIFEKRNTSLPMEFTRLDLAEGLSIIAMNAEVVVEYGLYVKSLNSDILPIGYSNGMIGYVPMEYQLRHDGYETKESSYIFHMPAMLEPEIEKDVKQALEMLSTKSPREVVG